MFNSKSKISFLENAANTTSIIGYGTTIVGDVQSDGDIRIDGILKGNLIAQAKILIGSNGLVEGNIEGKQADILGKVTGNIKITELLHLHGKATVDGNIYTNKLQIEPTASFNGECHMGANVVGLNTERANAINE